jgi:hypothetical protein
LMDPTSFTGRSASKGRKSTAASMWRPGTDKQWSDYINDESEIKAHLHEVYLDLRRGKAVPTATSYMLSKGEPRGLICTTILKFSPAWNRVESVLTPKNRRRFLRVAWDRVAELQQAEKGGEDELARLLLRQRSGSASRKLGR